MDTAKDARVRGDLKNLAEAIQRYALKAGKVPYNLNDLLVYDANTNPYPLKQLPTSPVDGSGPSWGPVNINGTDTLQVGLKGHSGQITMPVSSVPEVVASYQPPPPPPTASFSGYLWTIYYYDSTNCRYLFLLIVSNSATGTTAPASYRGWYSKTTQELHPGPGYEAVIIDGVNVGQVGAGGGFSVTGLSVGSHQLQFEYLQPGGDQGKRTDPVTINLPAATDYSFNINTLLARNYATGSTLPTWSF